MPQGALAKFRGQGVGASAPASSTYRDPFDDAPDTTDYDEVDKAPDTFSAAHGGDIGDSSGGAAVAGVVGAGALLAGLGLKRYGLGGAAKAAAKTVSNLRMASMLSGLAAPKSALGNVGAAVNMSLEQGNMGALKSFFSKQTAKDWWSELKNPNPMAGSTVPGASRYNPFGRIMGAGDVATQKAIVRSGAPKGEAELQTLQSALPERIGKALDNPIAEHAVPFRRTPINQAIEGGTTVTDAFKGSKVTRDYGKDGAYTASTRLPLAVHGAGGFAAGYTSSDDRFPIIPGAYAAFAGRYGLPALIAAYGGRIAAGGNTDSSIIGSAMPVAEYGVTQALDPRTALQPLDPGHSALARLIKRLNGEQ